ncbi:hypothetical protein HK101_002337 [Irineochytrium annulatum]|nr:hypothetical protein HK101_002337 [Irineochytrium annulatum]
MSQPGPPPPVPQEFQQYVWQQLAMLDWHHQAAQQQFAGGQYGHPIHPANYHNYNNHHNGYGQSVHPIHHHSNGYRQPIHPAHDHNYNNPNGQPTHQTHHHNSGYGHQTCPVNYLNQNGGGYENQNENSANVHRNGFHGSAAKGNHWNHAGQRHYDQHHHRMKSHQGHNRNSQQRGRAPVHQGRQFVKPQIPTEPAPSISRSGSQTLAASTTPSEFEVRSDPLTTSISEPEWGSELENDDAVTCVSRANVGSSSGEEKGKQNGVIYQKGGHIQGSGYHADAAQGNHGKDAGHHRQAQSHRAKSQQGHNRKSKLQGRAPVHQSRQFAKPQVAPSRPRSEGQAPSATKTPTECEAWSDPWATGIPAPESGSELEDDDAVTCVGRASVGSSAGEGKARVGQTSSWH